MRILSTIGLLLFCAALGACPARNAVRGGGRAPGFSKSQFVSIASGQQLGSAWSGAGGGVHELFADAEGNHALLVTRGAPGALLYLDRPNGNAIVDLGSAEIEPAYVDFQNAAAYGAQSSLGQAPLLQRRGLTAESSWEALGPLGEDPGCECLAVAGNSASGQIYALTQCTVAQESMPVQLEAAAGNLSREELRLYRSDGKSPPLLAGEYTRLNEPEQAGAPSLAVLNDGSACVCLPHSGDLEIVRGDGSRSSFSFPAGHEAIISADKSLPALWLYIRPDNSGEGTGREHASCQVGRLMVVSSDGQQLASASAGSVSFSELAGDFSTRRCLLAHSSMGVAEASLPSGEGGSATGPAVLTWLLRHGGDSPLFLLADGEQLWTAVDAGLYGISAAGLRQQSPNLAAAQALPRAQALPARTAVEALGWDWAATQISPLAGLQSKLTLFDSGDPNSSWAEMDWSAKARRAERVMVVRTPKQSDTSLRQADDAALEQSCKTLLSALGWPEARLSAQGIARDEFNLQASFDLAEAGAGEFSIWITDAATLLTLESTAAEAGG